MPLRFTKQEFFIGVFIGIILGLGIGLGAIKYNSHRSQITPLMNKKIREKVPIDLTKGWCGYLVADINNDGNLDIVITEKYPNLQTYKRLVVASWEDDDWSIKLDIRSDQEGILDGVPYSMSPYGFIVEITGDQRGNLLFKRFACANEKGKAISDEAEIYWSPSQKRYCLNVGDKWDSDRK